MPIGIVKPEMLKNKTNFGNMIAQETKPFKFYSPNEFYNSTAFSKTEKVLHFKDCQYYFYRVKELLKPIIELHKLRCEINSLETKTWLNMCGLSIELIRIIHIFMTSNIMDEPNQEVLERNLKCDHITLEYYGNYNWDDIFQYDYEKMEFLKQCDEAERIHGILTVKYVKKQISKELKKKYFINDKAKKLFSDYGIETFDDEKNRYFSIDRNLDFYRAYELPEIDCFLTELTELIKFQLATLRRQIAKYITSDRFFTNENGTTYIVAEASIYELILFAFSGLLQSQEEDNKNYCPSERAVIQLKKFESELSETNELINEYIENLEFQKIIPAEPEIKNKELSMDSDAIKLKLQKYSDLDIYSHPFFKAIPYNPGCQLAFCRAFVSNMITNFDDTQIFFSMEKGHFAKFIRDCRIRNWPLVDEFICLNSVKFPSDVQHTTAGKDYAHSIGKVIFPEKYLQ